MDLPGVHRLLPPPRAVAWAIHHVPACTSTQELAAQALERGEGAGFVICTDYQREGRGRHGATWVAASGSALLFSLLLEPGHAILPLTPLLSGVAVVDGIRAACGLQAELEWPNDVMVADRKLAGILVRHPPGDAVIVGIGINVSAHPGSAEVAAPATAIAEELHRPVDREPVLAAILAALDAYLEAAREGPTPILDAYRRRTSMLGKRIAYVMDGADRIAIARDVLEDGRLLVELPDGGLAQLVAGRVRQVRDPRA